MAAISINAADGGTFSAYLAEAKGTPSKGKNKGKGPGILLIQEIFGVNRWVREVADEYAAKGFTVMAPDLFWRQEPGVQLTDQTQSALQRAFQLMQGFDQDLGIADIKATLSTLKKHKACTGKVGAIGFCLGGRLAYMTAARTPVDCAVSYYGVGIEELLGEAKAIKKPLMLHIAEKDKFVPAEAQEKIKAGLKANKKVTINMYEGADHAFARTDGEHYDKAAATLAGRRTLAFLRENLEK